MSISKAFKSLTATPAGRAAAIIAVGIGTSTLGGCASNQAITAMSGRVGYGNIYSGWYVAERPTPVEVNVYVAPPRRIRGVLYDGWKQDKHRPR